MDDRMHWTWIMRGHAGLMRMMVAMCEEGEGVPAGAAVELKEQCELILQLIDQEKRDS